MSLAKPKSKSRPKPKAKARGVALVTGGASGIGAATCAAFAQRGYDVALNYRTNIETAETIASRCRTKGAETLLVRGDVGDDGDCRAMVSAAIERFGRLDVLVNSAGTTQFVAMADLDGLEAADFQRVYRINTIGPFQMVRAAAPHLRVKRGAVVNVSSVAGVVGNGSSIAYVASKAALNALTLALARSLGPEIRVNAVLPGLVQTDWVRRGVGDEAYARVGEQWAAAAALDKIATAEEVAKHIVFLAADATLMTGQLVTIDAGFLLGRPAKVSR
jgi:NAD(P)-dependent dehydrogenase (short-subunit alcohol dehydrogenase family)